MNVVRPSLVLLGLILGVAGGLLLGWLVFPVLAAATVPAQLRADHREAQILMIAAALRADNNMERARQRLQVLGLGDTAGAVGALAVRAEKEGRDVLTRSVLQDLTLALGAPTQAASDASEAEPTLDAGPTAAQPTAIPAATKVAALPSAVPPVNAKSTYEMISTTPMCDPNQPSLSLQVYVVDENSEELSGVPLELLSDGVVEKFFTGLKPERGGGYADFQMLPNVEYALQIDSQIPPLAAVSAPQCNAGSANAFSGYLLVRWQRRP